MFRFSLQVALDVRSRQEKIKMKELAEKLAVEQEIRNQMDRIKEDTRQADLRSNRAKESRLFTIEQMKFLANFKSRMRVVTADCNNRLEAAKKEVKEKQLILIEASKAKKTLEILKEKENKRYLEKISAMERKNMDEIAGNQFFQKLRKSS
ncbi:MAG: flagellar export protein FliJ [Proteobacteria bacterium]|nr:flagellar export protein FliJ [Pseudomonadota bacterium]